MKNSRTFLSLALPIVALVAMIGQAELNQGRGEIWEIKIRGYDPRDLLRGHYLAFRFDWNWAMDHGACTGGDCCLCLTKVNGSRTNPQVKAMSCSLAETCDARIRGMMGAGEFVTGYERYDIPEMQAVELEQNVRDKRASVLISIQKSGAIALKDLLVDGEPWKQKIMAHHPKGVTLPR